ncbi:MAG TPA: M56 family metallopeptidase [Steroidobacteraceae bacterium]|nr:M56 family metallopeptidase [Steroidobacteraceae bacterium]
MSASVLQAVIDITLASSIAILIVGALRKPLRRIAGARVAYGLWLAVPVTVVSLWLPGLPSSHGASTFFQQPLTRLTARSLMTTASSASSGSHATAALAIWLSGTLLLTAWLSIRQRTFRRSLECVACGADGLLRSDRIGAPMLVGAWRPRVVIPTSFEARYPEKDRALMLAHERAHRDRGDPLVNLIATLFLCLFWFNPLMYWGLGRFHFDQELACDAYVLSNSSSSKRRYAKALLKAQLTSQSLWQVPLGCHWLSDHPLKERIIMLKLPSPGLYRQLSGIAVTVAFTLASAYAVSSSFAQAPLHSVPPTGSPTSSAATDKRFSIAARNADTREILAMIARRGNANILVGDKVSGKMTIDLKDVTWRQALNIVVLSQGLVSRQSGDITIVGVPH